MKVDIESCTACGAKNSKFVQNCYRCKAPLPWSPEYKAPSAQPSAPAQAPAPAPGNSISTSPSPATPPAGITTPKIPEKVLAPTWGLAAVGGGLLFLGMGVMAVYMNATRTPGPTVIVAPTPAVSTSGVPEVTGNTAPVPNSNTAPAPAPAGNAAPVPATNATPAENAVPVPATNAAPAPVTTAPPSGDPAVPSPTTVSTPAAPPKLGPSFAEISGKLDSGTGNQTQAQRQSYWKSVLGTQVNWTGTLVDANSNGTGQVMLRCSPTAKGADVTVLLDGTQNAMLGTLTKGRKISVQGLLEDHTGKTYRLNQGRITGQG